jgi:WD40 repeat protein
MSRFSVSVGLFLMAVWLLPGCGSKSKEEADASPSKKTLGAGKPVSWDSSSVIKCDLKYPNAQMCVAFSPNGKMFACCGAESPLQLYDVSTKGLKATVDTEGGRSWTISFSPDGKRIAYPVGKKDKRFAIRDTMAETIQANLAFHRFSRSPTSAPYSAASYLVFSPNGKIVATASQDVGSAQQPHVKQVKLWDTATWQLQTELPGCYPITFSPDGNTIAMLKGRTYLGKGEEQTTIVLWDLAARKEKSVYRTAKKEAAIATLAFSPDGSLLAALHGQEFVNLWSVKTGTVTKQINPDFGVVTITFSPDSRYLAGVGGIPRNEATGTIAIWDWEQDREARLTGHSGWVQSLAFSREGELLATMSCDKTVRLWKRRSDEKGAFVFRGKDAIRNAKSPRNTGADDVSDADLEAAERAGHDPTDSQASSEYKSGYQTGLKQGQDHVRLYKGMTGSGKTQFRKTYLGILARFEKEFRNVAQANGENHPATQQKKGMADGYRKALADGGIH